MSWGPYDIPDHPVIANMMRTGYPDGKEPPEYCCPVCGAECETIYTDSCREPVGCDVCLSAVDAYDYYDQEGPEYEEDYDE